MNRLDSSTGRVDLCTPGDLLDRVRHVLGRIDLDPASNPRSIVGATVALVDPSREAEFGPLPEGFYYQDGLAFDWGEGATSAYVNPPYGRAHNRAWAQKVQAEAQARCSLGILALVPVGTSETWWQPYWDADVLAFLVGRVKHVGEPHGATFAQAAAGWNVDGARFREAFEGVSRIG